MFKEQDKREYIEQPKEVVIKHAKHSLNKVECFIADVKNSIDTGDDNEMKMACIMAEYMNLFIAEELGELTVQSIKELYGVKIINPITEVVEN